MDSVSSELRDRITIVRLSRPGVRNAVDGPTAQALARAFRDFDANPDSDVAIFHGEYGTFCAGADLKAVAAGAGGNQLTPVGESRLRRETSRWTHMVEAVSNVLVALPSEA